jgi:hypothetical protein
MIQIKRYIDKPTEIIIEDVKYSADEIKRISFKTYSSFDENLVFHRNENFATYYHFKNGINFNDDELK